MKKERASLSGRYKHSCHRQEERTRSRDCPWTNLEGSISEFMADLIVLSLLIILCLHRGIDP